jgi:hypothetical protein
MVVTGWAPQTAILAHPVVGSFVTHCGWNSVLEAIAAGVPVLTWPMVVEQFITERFVTEVLAIGERLWPEGARVRSTRSEEHELIPAEAIAQAVAAFMEPGGGAGGLARSRVKDLSVKAHAALEDGGSSHRDLRRLIDDLIEARAAAAERENFACPCGHQGYLDHSFFWAALRCVSSLQFSLLARKGNLVTTLPVHSSLPADALLSLHAADAPLYASAAPLFYSMLTSLSPALSHPIALKMNSTNFLSSSLILSKLFKCELQVQIWTIYGGILS